MAAFLRSRMTFQGIVNWTIPVEIWNHAVRALWRARPRAGTYCLLLELPDGTLISADPASSWQHPWFTLPRWNGKEWTATIKPGFVNEWDPIVPGVPRSKKDPEDSDLTDFPDIPLRAFRSVPAEGEPIPPFFAALGVRDLRDKIRITEIGGTLEAPEIDAETPPRALVAMDFYVATARATYESRAQEIDASGTSGVTVDYFVSFNTAQLEREGQRPRLMQAGKFPAVKPPTLAERLLGQYQDEGEDRVLISTVYLLSPPNKLNGPPDQSWTAFVQHNQFWNLSHAGRNLPPAKDPKPIRLFTGLIGGLGDLIGNQILSGINEYSDRVLNAVNTTTNEGRYWTA